MEAYPTPVILATMASSIRNSLVGSTTTKQSFIHGRFLTRFPNDSYFMYLKPNYYLMTREQRPIYNITRIPVQVSKWRCISNVELPAINSVPTRFQKSFQKDDYLVIFWKDLNNILDLGDSKIHLLLKMITQPFLWIPDWDTFKFNLSRGVIEAPLLMYARCILKG